jgi:hypothetical protein
MKRRYFAIGLVAAITLASCTSGTTKDKIIGKWQNESDVGISTVTFLSDGTALMNLKRSKHSEYIPDEDSTTVKWDVVNGNQLVIITDGKSYTSPLAINGDTLMWGDGKNSKYTKVKN